ncbi:MAG: hypothetical protein RLO50_13340 [Azospirillaceae bacterium]
MAVVEELLVRIDATTENLRRQLRQADQATAGFAQRTQQNVSRMEASFNRLGGVAARAFAGFIGVQTVRALVNASRRAVELADAMSTAADRIGVTTDELQIFRFAAEDAANLGISAADTALQRFSRRVGEAIQGTGVLRDVLEQNNIALRNADGSVRSVTDILGDYAEVVANAGSAQEQLALTVRAFDTEGAALVTILRQGRDGWQEFTEAALDAGIVTEDAIRRAEELDRELTRASQTIDSNLTEAFIAIAPVIVDFTRLIADAITGVQEFGRTIRNAYVDQLERLSTMLDSGFTLDLGIMDLTPEIQRQVDALQELRRQLTGIESDRPDSTFQPSTLDPSLTGGGGGGGRAEDDPTRPDDLTSFLSQQAQEVTLLRVRAEAIAQGNTAQARANLLATEWFQQLANNNTEYAEAAPILQDYAMSQVEASDALARMQEAQALVDDALEAGIDRTALYAEAMDILRQRFDAGAISATEFAAAQDVLNDTGEAMPEWARTAGAAFTDAFGDMVTGAASAEEAFGRLAQRLADMIIEMTIMQPLAEALSQTLSGFGGGGGGGGFGGFIAGLFGAGGKVPTFSGPGVPKIAGFRADGGPVSAGKAYVVGERGPELFVPDIAGHIAANGTRAGGGNTINAPVTITIDATGADREGLVRLERRVDSLARELPAVIEQTVGEKQRNRRLR